jgi:DNA repair exonuclease SbcCD nuclease subunit
MSRIILSADWHVEKGMKINSILIFLDTILKYYLENNIDYVFILGDIFDRASNIKNEAFIPLFLKLYEMKGKGVKFLFIVGNHDQFLTDGSSIVETFAPLGIVIKEKTHSSAIPGLEDKDWFFMPYTKKQEELPEAGDVLFTHLSIANFSFDNAYHATEKHAFPTKLFENFSKTFLGHFHRHQVQGNIIYAGSPIQLTRSEEGVKKGFIIFDDEDQDNWSFIEFDDYPKYLTITSSNIKNIAEMNFENKLVYVKIDKKINDFVKLKYILYDRGAIDVTPIFENEDTQIILENKIELDDNVENIAKEYISNIKLEEIKGIDVEGINKDVLLKIFEHVVGNCK